MEFTIEEAKLIREIKKGCSFRRLAEIYYPADHPLHGNQIAGTDLCEAALKALGIDRNDPRFQNPPASREDENCSRIYRPFWWWE